MTTIRPQKRIDLNFLDISLYRFIMLSLSFKQVRIGTIHYH